MARNATLALTADQSASVVSWNKVLCPLVSQRVSIDYIKRDGSPANLTGTLIDVMGATEDKRVAKVDTDNGPRSANLWGIVAAVPSW